ncbi:hypothetical protein C4K68_14135 [Pokkaliibacter plantistimulans]|uniref:Hydro-lyase n=1 Tax=Proteobacteria bacterium 228 TaxID=2083153 RepID=A0A2S5KPN4_9PROT|nr:DUF1445 domain-containing protein [Pokkaliibacter plantistimulans]PPC76700.1 hypothetical protein C4K68_14135 [Pokkaliibacter plantistimulans]
MQHSGFSTPAELRALIARGEWSKPTSGILDDYQQANLAVVPQAQAYDFLLFCHRNPKACPLLAVTDVGNPMIEFHGSVMDVRTMIPRYRVWKEGQLVAEPTDLSDYWQDDSVAFLLGCSHTFDAPLGRAGIPVSVEAPAVYFTSIPCTAVGSIRGNMVVSMRPVEASKVPLAMNITARYPSGHGAPVHVGDPALIGIGDLSQPDFGVFPGVAEGYVPVYWACGVTPQVVLPGSGGAYLFTHYAGHMMVMDHTVDEVAGFTV